MEVWTEQFRLWLAAELLQPLDKLVRRAQKVLLQNFSKRRLHESAGRLTLAQSLCSWCEGTG